MPSRAESADALAIGIPRAMPIGEQRALLREQPRELVERIFAPTHISRRVWGGVGL